MVFYGTVAEFTAYHEARGREIPGTWDDTKIEAALLVASEWIDGTYGNQFIGEKKEGFLQDREWPRINAVTNNFPIYVFPDDVIPVRIEHATYEAAFREATTAGSLLKDYTPGKYRRASVDGAVSVEYAQFTFASDTQTTFPIIDRLLWPLLDPENAASFSSYSGATTRV